MFQNITTTTMNINGREFVLAEVKKGASQVGLFRYSTVGCTATDVFYIENEPIIRIDNPYTKSRQVDKLITQMSGSEKCSDSVKSRFKAAVENLYRYDQGLLRSAVPVLELLAPGLYVIHEAQVHPSNGSGEFFWNAYSVKREVMGTAERNHAIVDNNFTPGFLIPTIGASSYQAVKMYSLASEISKGAKHGGVAYHVSGMHSALLCGHHAAVASLISSTDFRCMVIEPVTEVIYSPTDEDDFREMKISALACPFVNIPLERLPENALECFLITRKHTKHRSFADMKAKLNKTVRLVSKRSFPATVYEGAAQLPGIPAVEAASAIDALTDEQIDALLAGLTQLPVRELRETPVQAEDAQTEETTQVAQPTEAAQAETPSYIVSPNYYTSIVAATNFLHATDFDKFVKFTTGILSNPELTAAHKYTAERLLTVMHPKIYEFFCEVIRAGVEKYKKKTAKPVENSVENVENDAETAENAAADVEKAVDAVENTEKSVETAKTEQAKQAQDANAAAVSATAEPAQPETLTEQLELEQSEQPEQTEQQKKDIVLEIAQRYIRLWTAYTTKVGEDRLRFDTGQKKNLENIQAVTEAKGIATLEVAVRTIGEMPKIIRN